MAYGVHPLLPLDIVDSTFLAPTQDFGISTRKLIAIRARQLQKCPKDIQQMQEAITATRWKNLKRFEEQHRRRIVNFDHQPGALVLVRNSQVEDALNRKTLPRYYGLVVIVQKTQGSFYVVAELDGAQSEQHIASFHLIPYLPRVATDIPIISNVPEAEQIETESDPEEVLLCLYY